MRTRGLAAVTVISAAVCAASGCVPSRDNANDPAEAPSVALQVDALPAGYSCTADAVLSPALQPVAAASRGRCLALDARASRSRRGALLAAPDFVFEWDSNGAGALVPLPPEATAALTADSSGQPGLALLDSDWLRSTVSPNRVVRFGVRVQAGGHAGSSAADLYLSNARPTAIGDPPRTLPSGGLPWQLGQPITVTLDASRSVDDDEDPIRSACWTIASATTCAPAGTLSTTIDVDPTVSGMTIAQLVVSDGAAQSAPAPVLLRVGAPSPWTQYDLAPFTVERLDPDRIQLSPIGSAQRWRAFDLPGVTDRAAILGDKQGTILVELANGAGQLFGATQSFNHDNGAAAVDPATGAGLWVAGDAAPSGLDVHRYDTNGAGWSAGVSLSVAEPAGTQLAGIAALPSGDAWIAFTGTGGFVDVSSNGTTAPVVAPGDHSFVAMATRPGTGEVWVIAAPTVTATTVSYQLRVYSSAQSFVAIDLPAGDAATALAWDGPDVLWLAIAGESMRRIDADALLATQTASPAQRLDAATRSETPLLDGVISMAVAPLDGSVWARTSALTEVHASADGTLQTFDVATDQLQADFVDAQGAVWFHGVGTLFRGQAPTEGDVSKTPALQQGGYAQMDDVEGGVWKYSSALQLLAHIAEDGTIRRLVTRIQKTPGGAPVPYPLSFGVLGDSVTPDGTHVWVQEQPSNAIWRYDLSQEPPFASPPYRLDPAGPSLQLGPPGLGPLTWVTVSGSTSHTIGTLTTAGVFTQRTIIPATEPQVLFAKSPRTDAMCVVSNATSTSTLLNVRYVTPATVGVPAPILQPDTTYFQEPSVAVSNAGALDTCWVGYYVPSSPPYSCGVGLGSVKISSVVSNGTTPATYTISGVSLSQNALGSAIAMTSPHDLWVQADECNPSGALSPVVYHLNTTTGQQQVLHPGRGAQGGFARR